ncbi:MAG: glycosyltransferase family 2 protein [Methyloceanibacter sp.]|uniref:glycosyltransferase family 2 protein n=1 Tax=Methyloceanibacter sp. TaxID=1965321 RepID=UPI003D9B2EDB
MHTYKPVVDVLLTVYNRVDYLDTCIKSVLEQRRGEFLLTVLDDGNCEHIARIIARYTSPLVRHHLNPERMGVAASIFAAIKRTPCDYFSIINDDDYWHSNFLAELLPPLEQDPTIAISFCDHWLVDAKSRILVKETDVNTCKYGRAQLTGGVVPDLTSLVIKKNGIPMAMGSVVRKSAISEQLLLPQVHSAYDYWLSLIVSQHANKAYYSPRRLSYYRVHASMETASKSARRGDSIASVYAAALIHGVHRKHSLFFIKRLFKSIGASIKDRLTATLR